MRQISDKILFIESKLNSDVDIELMPKGDHPVDPSQQMSGRLNLIMQEGNKGVLTNVKGTTNSGVTCYVSLPIVLVEEDDSHFEVEGDITSILFVSDEIQVVGSTNNNATYTVNAISYSGGNTSIEVDLSVDESVTDGHILFEIVSVQKIIKTVYDESSNCLYLLVYSADGYHNVLRYNNDDSIDLIYSGTDLNFQATEVIHNIGIIGTGVDKQICWTSSDNPPRSLNISRAENFEYLSNEDLINLALTPPDTPLTWSFTDIANGINNIYNKVYQFCHKYIYFDGKESSWSEYTDVIYNIDNESINGLFNNDVSVKNAITLSDTTIPDGVTKVKIGYRYADTLVGTESALYEYDVVDVSANAISYVFLDNKIKSVADTTDGALKSYEVPEYGTDLEILNDNKIAIINPTLGKDNVDINVSLQAVYSDNTNIPLTIHSSTNIASGGGTGVITIASNTNVPYLEIISFGEEDEVTKIITYVVGDNSLDYAYQAAQKINDSGFTGVSAARTGVNQITITNNVASAYSINVYRESLEFMAKYPNTKSGATHYLGIEYTDGKGRVGRVNISNNSQISMPWWNDVYNLSNDGYSLGIAYEITHLPPSWATTWQWVYAGNNINNFYQLVIQTSDVTRSGGNIVIDVQAADNRVLAKNPNYNSLISFDVAIGDKVRFKSKGLSTDRRAANSIITNDFTYFTNYIELEIIDINSGTGELTLEGTISNSEYNDIIGTGSYDLLCIEVLSYEKEIDEDNLIYQGIGKVLDCSNGYHSCSVPNNQLTSTWRYETNGVAFSGRNQTGAQTGLGIIEMFDTYNVFSHLYDVSNASEYDSFVLGYLESRSSSFGYPSQKVFGKINYVDAQASNRQLIGVAYGGSYSETGLIYDELNKFLESDVVEIGNKHGVINAGVLIGNSLKLFQNRKLTTIWNNKQEIYNQDGSISIVALQESLGSPNVLDDDYGCVFPQAIAKKDRYLYFPDIYAGKVIRNASNGNEEISRYGMEKFFRIRFKALLESGVENIKMTGIYDYITRMYLLSVEDTVTASNSFMIGFEEDSNSWKTFFSGNFDLFDAIGHNRTFGFEDENIYELFNTSTRNNIKSTQYSSYVTIVTNPGAQCVFESIWINSNSKNWGSTENDDIIIHDDGGTYTDTEGYTRHKTKMQSRLKSGLFKFLEGLFKADYLRNIITSSSTPKQSDLYQGDVLRGRYLKQTLRNTDTSEVHLRDVTINSSVSSGN